MGKIRNWHSKHFDSPSVSTMTAIGKKWSVESECILRGDRAEGCGEGRREMGRGGKVEGKKNTQNLLFGD